MSNLWFSKQMIKNKPKKIENIYIKEDTKEDIIETIEKTTKEEEKLEMEKLIVAIDAGKGYTKYFYAKEVETRSKKDNSIVKKPKGFSGIDKSTVVIGQEAVAGSTIYINDKPCNFNGTKKVVELEDKTKNSEEHKALMQKTLFEIAKKEKVNLFDVIMCTSLDQYKLEENVEEMQKEMNIGTFNIKDDADEISITVEKVIIEPESIVSTIYAKTVLKDVLAVLVDIGTLNVGVVPLNMGRLNKEAISAPRIGYDHMINMFKEYTDSKGANYSKEMLEVYVDKKQGTMEKLDEMFKSFFVNEYSKILKKEIDAKGFGEFANLIFMGGTSIKCGELIKETFSEYENVEIIEDIYATVKGAYLKGKKDLEKLN